MATRNGWRALACAALVWTSAPSLAHAACQDEPRVCGRRAFDDGVKAYEAGKFKKALAKFREAHGIQRHPIVTYNLALAEAEVGLVHEAIQHVRDVADDPSADDKLKKRANDDARRFEAKLSRVSVEVAGAKLIEVEIDGVDVSSDDLVFNLNPSKHEVVVIADGRVVLKKALDLRPGERVTLTVDHSREVVVQEGDRPQQTAPVDGGPSGGMSPAWFYVSAGVTVGLGAVTIWSGVDTLGAKDDFDRLSPTLPQDEAQKLLDDGHSKEKRTNALIGVTALGALATGAIGLFAVDWGKGQEVSVGLGPGGFLATGRF